MTSKRVGPLKNNHRLVVFDANNKDQEIEVKDTIGKFVFNGLMADSGGCSTVRCTYEN